MYEIKAVCFKNQTYVYFINFTLAITDLTNEEIEAIKNTEAGSMNYTVGPQNPVVIITKGSDEIKLPVNKNIAYVNGKAVKLDGVTVFNGIHTYVPQSAIELIK